MGQRRKESSRARRSTACLFGVLILAGCSEAIDERVDQDVSASSERLGPALEALRRIDNRVHIVEARPWLGLHRLRSEHGNPLPADLTKPGAIALPFEAELFPEELAGRLTAVIGVPVVLVGDAPTSTDGASTVPASWRPEAEPAEGAPVQWSGPLDELLNAWTSAYGYEWRYEEGTIRILRTVTALLRVNALAGSRQLSTSIGTQSEASGGTGASAGASSSQRLRVEYGENFWLQVQEQIEGLVSENTAVTVTPATGTVTIHGRPAEVRRVRDILGEQNREVLRPVVVTLELMEVSTSDGIDFRADLAAYFRKFLGSSVAFAVAGGGGAIGIVRPSPFATAQDTLDLTVAAIASYSETARRLRTSVGTLNGLPVSSHDLQSQAYLASVSREESQSGTTITLEPGSVSSGYFFTAHPQIVAPDRVLLRLQFSHTALLALREFSSGDNTIQLPEQLSRALTLEQTLSPGETLVVSGFSDVASAAARSGPFHARNPLGGERAASVKNVEQVLLVTVAIDRRPEWSEGY